MSSKSTEGIKNAHSYISKESEKLEGKYIGIRILGKALMQQMALNKFLLKRMYKMSLSIDKLEKKSQTIIKEPEE